MHNPNIIGVAKMPMNHKLAVLPLWCPFICAALMSSSIANIHAMMSAAPIRRGKK